MSCKMSIAIINATLLQCNHSEGYFFQYKFMDVERECKMYASFSVAPFTRCMHQFPVCFQTSTTQDD